MTTIDYPNKSKLVSTIHRTSTMPVEVQAALAHYREPPSLAEAQDIARLNSVPIGTRVGPRGAWTRTRFGMWGPSAKSRRLDRKYFPLSFLRLHPEVARAAIEKHTAPVPTSQAEEPHRMRA